MAALIWKNVRNLLIVPFVDLKLISFDLSLKNRNDTKDKITHDAAKALKL